jgi:hypothetical protein
MDSFNFGKPARARSVEPRTLVIGVVALAVVVIVVVGFLQFVGNSGEEAAGAEVSAVQQIDVAGDLQAKTNAQTAEAAAAVALTSSGSFAEAGADKLAAIEPSLTYTNGPSTSATLVSVAASPTAWAAAVLGPSGTCYWISLDASSAVHYGTGATCTGAAAMAATEAAW